MSTTTAPSSWQLQKVVSLAQSTLESLRTEHGQVFDTDADLLTALADEHVDVESILRRLISAALDARADLAAAKERIADLQVRAARFARREKAYRATAADVMTALELTRFPTAEATLTLTPAKPRMLLPDLDAQPDALPDDLVTITITRMPNRAAIEAALDAGREIPSVGWSNGGPPVISFRSK